MELLVVEIVVRRVLCFDFAILRNGCVNPLFTNGWIENPPNGTF